MASCFVFEGPLSSHVINFVSKNTAMSLPLPLTLDFLSTMYEKVLSSYSTINTARSMLSSIVQLNINSSIPFGQLPIVRRFMKGLFELRPALP